MKLILGDCLEKMKDIEDGSIDMILVDPPYQTTKCKWDSIIPLDLMWIEIKRIRKERSAIVFMAGQPFTSALIMSNVKEFKYCWVWDKVTARGHLVAKKRPMAQHEDICVFYKKAPTYNPQMIDRPKDKIEIRKTTEYKRTEICGGVSNAPVDVVYDKWYPKTIIVESNAGSSVKSQHPTQKPVPLMEYLIKTYTNENDVVLDFAFGSGTTAIACLNTNREFIGIEKDEKYFQIAQDRIDKHTLPANNEN